MTQEYSGSDDDSKSGVLMIHPDRVGADPTEGWRRGSRGTLRKSCDTCTSSKTKCQGSIPCDRCKKRRIECKFSKRRRCGPKARTEDEKRPRTSMGMGSHPGRISTYSPERSGAPHHHAGTSRPPSPPLPPIGTIGLDNSGGDGGGSSALPRSSPKFGGPLTSDGLSGLVELIAPTLSDTGGSGSSASISASISANINASINSSCHGGGESGYSHAVGASGSRYAPINAMDTGGVSPFLGGPGTSPPHQHHGGTNTGSRPGLPPSSAAAAAATRSSMPAAVNHSARQEPVRNGRGSLTSSHSAPMGTISASALPCPPQDLPARAKSVESATGVIGSFEKTRGAGQISFFPEARAVADSMGNSGYMRVDRGEGRYQAAAAAAAPPPPQPSSRGPLSMSLDSRTKMHLRTFMRTVGSLVLLPGTDAIRAAIFSDGNDSEEVPDAAATPVPGDATAAADAAGSSEDVRKGVGKRAVRSASGEAGSDDGPVALAEACRAEAWAAAAMGALFSGAPEEEAKDYVSRALRAIPGCLDASYPEVAAVMILLALFWMHSMDTRKVARYFGFAQQVGLELGPLMPEGLRHTIAFVSSLVTMTLNLDQLQSFFSLEVKDHAVWGVSLRNSSSSRPSVDPFILALTATTVVCNEILHDRQRRASPGAIGVNGLSPPLPSQTLTDLLATAAKTLGKAEVQDGNQNPEHMLALLHGLKGYTHASRGELGEAEASARLMLEIIDRHAAVLHLPLTFTLAEASRRLLRATAEQSSRPALPGVHVDALRMARSTLSFARPRQPGKSGPGGGGGTATGGGGGGGGWCSFGSDILAAFDRVAGVDGGGVLPEKTNEDRDRSHAMPSRSGSMSPPPRRSVKPLPRAVIASQQWKPTTGAGEITSSSSAGSSSNNSNNSSSSSRHAPRASLEAASPLALSRWDAPLPATATPAPSSSSVLLRTGAEAPTSWVERVRKMPTVAPTRPSSPNVVHRMAVGGAGARTPPPEGNGPSATSLPMLGPGPMPTAPPGAVVKYPSEPPDNLALLSTVASPEGYSVPPRRSSFDDRSGMERQQQPVGRQRRSAHTGGGGGGVGGSGSGGGGGNGSGGGGSGGGTAERDADDLPPPGNPGLTTGMSFDPNRDDGTFPFTLGSS